MLALEVNSQARIKESVGEDLKAPPKLLGVEYGQKEALEARDTGRLLRINIETAQNQCNLQCIYCYSFNTNSRKSCSNLTEEDVSNIIIQAKDLGVRSVVFTGGGEPLLDKKRFFAFAKFTQEQGLIPVVFTNGTCIDRETAYQLDFYGVTVVTKLNSLKNPEITNELSGRSWAYRQMRQGLQYLLETELAERHQLGLETVITKRNYEEITEMWRWVREHNIIPYFELVKVQGRAQHFANVLEITQQDAKKLFELLLNIDRKEFGYSWHVVPPLPGSHCNRLYCGCYVRTNGDVQPCAGIPIRQGNLKEEPLADIVHKNSFNMFRHIEKHLKGNCGRCGLKGFCYGCRGNAYAVTGDPFSGDPACWR